MGIIGAIFFGLFAGILAKILMPGRDPGGFIVTTLLGIAGAVVGKFVSSLVSGPADVMRWTWPGFFFSVVGAMLLLFLYRLVAGRRRA